jgi:hypothetical protein
MYTLKIQNLKGEILNFADNTNYDVLKIDGLTPPPSTLNFSELANYDGSIFNSGQLQNRNIVLTIKLYGDVEKSRIELYKYFQLKKQIRIYYENNTRKVYIDGYVETFEADLFVMNETVQISVICPDPHWKDDVEMHMSFSNVIDMFEFPFAISEDGIEFSILENTTSSIIENGDIESGMTIEFIANTNRILNPRIINRTTQQYFGVNFDMNEGDVIRINTIRGKKSVMLIRDGTETNVINYMQSGSEWIQLASGDNELSYECDEGQANLTVHLYSTKRYEGV